MPRPAGAEPQQPGQAHRGGEPDGVPVAERLAQAGVDLVRVQHPGQHLRHERVPGDEDRAQRDRAQHRRPAAAGEMRERDGRRERGEVGEMAVRVDPRVGRVDRPRHRPRGDRREDEHRRDRQRPVQALARGGGDERRGDHRAGRDEDADLGRRRRAEAHAAVGDRAHRAQRRREEQRDRDVDAGVARGRLGRRDDEGLARARRDDRGTRRFGDPGHGSAPGRRSR